MCFAQTEFTQKATKKKRKKNARRTFVASGDLRIYNRYYRAAYSRSGRPSVISYHGVPRELHRSAAGPSRRCIHTCTVYLLASASARNRRARALQHTGSSECGDSPTRASARHAFRRVYSYASVPCDRRRLTFVAVPTPTVFTERFQRSEVSDNRSRSNDFVCVRNARARAR